MFSNRDKLSEVQTDTHAKLPNPPRKPSTWRAPPSKSVELETFIANVERSLFENTSRRKVKDNLSSGERKNLNDWRKKPAI